MKIIFFQIGKQVVFPEFSKDQPDNFYVTIAGVSDVNQNVIKVYDDENIKLFC